MRLGDNLKLLDCLPKLPGAIEFDRCFPGIRCQRRRRPGRQPDPKQAGEYSKSGPSKSVQSSSHNTSSLMSLPILCARALRFWTGFQQPRSNY